MKGAAAEVNALFGGTKGNGGGGAPPNVRAMAATDRPSLRPGWDATLYDRVRDIIDYAIGQLTGIEALDTSDPHAMVRAVVNALQENGATREAIINMRPYIVEYIFAVQSGEHAMPRPQEPPPPDTKTGDEETET